MPTTCTAFDRTRRLASGSLPEVAAAVKATADADPEASILIFDDATARPIELDLRGTTEEVLARLPEPAAEADGPAPRRGPGRPKLGVVGREVTLLPRHWEWLAAQPGGASVALRKLVEAARREHAGRDRVRTAQDAAFRFMNALAGDAPGFEEAVRALFAGDAEGFAARTEAWPPDVRDHARELAKGAI